MTPEKTAKLFLIQRTALIKKIKETEEGKRLAKSEEDLTALVKQTQKSGNMESIVQLEKTILEHIVEEHINSKAMNSSFARAVLEMELIENNMKKVHDYEKYREVYNSIEDPNKRQKGLPIDDARTAFASHSTRLTNQDKAGLSDGEKKMIDARRSAFNIAHKLYQESQAKALGITLKQAKSRGR